MLVSVLVVVGPWEVKASLRQSRLPKKCACCDARMGWNDADRVSVWGCFFFFFFFWGGGGG